MENVTVIPAGKTSIANVLPCSGCHQHRDFSMAITGLLGLGQGSICCSVTVPPIFEIDGYHF